MAHVIVCGLGQVGYRITELLLSLGEQVTVVTLSTTQEFRSDVENHGAKVIIGDARNERQLFEAGLATADALIACIDSDLGNVEIALDVRRYAPQLRIVVRLFDQMLAKRLESALGIHRALAMSHLAAPAFAAAALGETVHGSFTWKDQHFVAASNGEAESHRIQLAPKRSRRIHGRMSNRIRHMVEACQEAWQGTPWLLRWVAWLIPVMTALSVGIFHVGMNLSPLDALYFVITTVTTTGYGDISPKDSSAWVKIYACLLMVLGSASVAVLYSLITDFMITSRFRELMGRRAVRSQEHVIVVGLGNVGLRTVEALCASGAEVAVIDIRSEPPLRHLLPEGVAFISGDGRDDETLDLAGIDTAQAIIAATDDDSVNLSTCLCAHEMNPHARVVVRLFDTEFAKKVEEFMSVNRAISATRIAAPGFVSAALHPDSVFSYVTGDQLMVVKPDAQGNLSTESFKFVRSWES